MHRVAAYLAILFGFCFSLFAAIVYWHPTLVAGIDAAAHALILPLQSGLGVAAFLVITNFGSTAGIIAGLVVITIIFRHRPDIVTRLITAIVGATISGEYLKQLVARARPETLPGLARIASYSFPSGHSYSSMVLYGFLALLLYIHTHAKWERWVAIILPACIILLVGLSRLVLDYHYISDVIGGYLLGAFWICLALAIPLPYFLYHLNSNRSEPLDRPVL